MPDQKLEKALLFWETIHFGWKRENFDQQTPTMLQFNIFCWNFAHVFYLLLAKKACVGFFLFYLDLELFVKVEKNLVCTHSFFILLLITQDQNKIKKYPTHRFENITK